MVRCETPDSQSDSWSLTLTHHRMQQIISFSIFNWMYSMKHLKGRILIQDTRHDPLIHLTLLLQFCLQKFVGYCSSASSRKGTWIISRDWEYPSKNSTNVGHSAPCFWILDMRIMMNTSNLLQFHLWSAWVSLNLYFFNFNFDLQLYFYSISFSMSIRHMWGNSYIFKFFIWLIDRLQYTLYGLDISKCLTDLHLLATWWLGALHLVAQFSFGNLVTT